MTEQQQIAKAIREVTAMPQGAYTKFRNIARVDELKLSANHHDLIALKRAGLIEFAGDVFKGQRYWRATPLGASVATRMGLV